MTLNFWEAVTLGLVEGLTEYLPVSSTGHLLLTERLLGISTATTEAREASDAFAICIQAGAILAVLGLYFSRVRDMVLGLLGKNSAGLKMAINVLIAFLPAVVVGLKWGHAIKDRLFHLWPVSIAWFVGGIAILAACVMTRRANPNERGQKGRSLSELTWKMALLIGLMQCIAMWPGVSRSLITIVGGLVVGLSLPAAVEFSFLLGLLTLTAATGKDALEHGSLMVKSFGASALFWGLAAAWVSAWVSVKWMVRYLQTHSFAIFGYYRIALGLVVGALILTGVLSGD